MGIIVQRINKHSYLTLRIRKQKEELMFINCNEFHKDGKNSWERE